MKNFAQKIKRFLKSEDGPTAVEYAVMLSLIIVQRDRGPQNWQAIEYE